MINWKIHNEHAAWKTTDLNRCVSKNWDAAKMLNKRSDFDTKHIIKQYTSISF